MRTALTIALGLAAYFLLENGQVTPGVFAAIAMALLISAPRLSGVVTAIAKDQLTHERNHDCNVAIDVTIIVNNVLRSEPVRALYRRLKAAGRITAATEDDWTRELLERHTARLGEREKWATAVSVAFHVRGDQVWKDGKRWFWHGPGLFHEILIPEESMKHPPALGMSGDEAYRGLRIRLVVVNGILKLQVGEFDETDSPEVIRHGREWRSWQAVNTFPLIYCPLKHQLPERLLNVEYAVPEGHKTTWARNTLRDYQRHLREDRLAYRRVIETWRTDDPEVLPDFSLERDISKRFRQWLEREKFEGLDQEPPEAHDWPRSFTNPYLEVWIEDFRDFDWLKAYSDFSEREP